MGKIVLKSAVLLMTIIALLAVVCACSSQDDNTASVSDGATEKTEPVSDSGDMAPMDITGESSAKALGVHFIEMAGGAHTAGEVYKSIPIAPEEVLSTKGLNPVDLFYNGNEKITQYLTPDGQNRVKTFYYSRAGELKYITIEVLDENNSPTVMAEYSSSGEMKGFYICTDFDQETGLPGCKVSYDPKANITGYTAYQYDENGNYYVDAMYDAEVNFVGKKCYDYKESFYIVYEYDAQETLLRYVVYDYPTDAVNYTYTIYDANNNVLDEELESLS